ncbi:Anti-sigma-I factor RsgI like [Actinidia chinensis var. chinensis]|uniref:Anti-sigma-I factor RsgI like n=1 Tax=Actinidia chinensis var. chinensis TaxID=1590841 RepID=A0A2R6QIN0_ACTCC|nr:Anti-sigma-I factor RsgI like [Actinidia chinensis var. chinensis]
MNLTPTPTPTPTVCGTCGADDRSLLHHVRHRGLFRRLCTSCVLRLHPQSFCPTCFLVFDRPPQLPSSSSYVLCLNCYSHSHPHCVPSSSPTPYVCPPCANPNTPIFDAKKTDGGWREIDKKTGKVLLAAAKIAAASMSKAAVAARVEAEKRAKDAANTRKRAREALEHVAFLVAKEKLKRKDLVSVEVSKNQKAGNGGGSRVGGIAKLALVVAEQSQMGPNEVSARLNAVGLKEKEGLQGFGEQNNGAVKGVENNERLRVSSGSNVGGSLIQNNGDEKPGNLGQLENNNAQAEKVNNGLHSVPSVGDEEQHMQNNGGRQEDMATQQ